MNVFWQTSQVNFFGWGVFESFFSVGGLFIDVFGVEMLLGLSKLSSEPELLLISVKLVVEILFVFSVFCCCLKDSAKVKRFSLPDSFSSNNWTSTSRTSVIIDSEKKRKIEREIVRF